MPRADRGAHYPSRTQASSSGEDAHPPLPCIAHHPRQRTYGIALSALQLEIAVELVWGRALALHLLADVEGAAPGAIFPAVDDVAPTALHATETQSDRERPHPLHKKPSNVSSPQRPESVPKQVLHHGANPANLQ